MKYKKYFRKTSLKQKGVGDFFLNEVLIKRPKVFLEVGVFHGVTARNVCELLNNLHGKDFKYIGLDLFEENLAAVESATVRSHIFSLKYHQGNLLSILAFSNYRILKYHVPQCDNPKEVLIAI